MVASSTVIRNTKFERNVLKMVLNSGTSVNDLCGKCKNLDICKFALTSQEAFSGLRIVDGSGPFIVSVDCKYRVVGAYSNTRALGNTFSDETVINQ